MHEGNLVICDQEQQYARNLLQMFARNRESEVQMYLFHTVEEAEKFAEQKAVHTLLIGKEYPLEQRERLPAEERFVLVKSKQEPLAENEVGIYRYQSAEQIWSQMCHKETPDQRRETNGPQNAAESERQKKTRKPNANERDRNPQDVRTDERSRSLHEVKTNARRRKTQGARPEERSRRHPEPREEERRQNASANSQATTARELIGVYSPVHRIGKTRFALELGRELSKKEPVLYLNLEEYAGGSYYFPDQTDQTLADLLYYARQEKGNLGLRISTLVGQDQDLDYILPMPYVEDLQGVTAEEWLRLFEQILEHCLYKKVILDLGDSVNGLFQILEVCDTVYTPYIEEAAARAKLNQYAENLRKTGRESVLEKTVQKKLKQR